MSVRISTSRAVPALLRRDGALCRDCSVPLAHESLPGTMLPLDGAFTHAPGHAFLTVDHVIPQSVGGPDAMDNYELVCGRCNNLRWRAWLAANPEATP